MRPPLRVTQSSLDTTAKRLVWCSVRAECLSCWGSRNYFYFPSQSLACSVYEFKKNNDFDSVLQSVICFSPILRFIHEAHRTANSRIQCQYAFEFRTWTLLFIAFFGMGWGLSNHDKNTRMLNVSFFYSFILSNQVYFLLFDEWMNKLPWTAPQWIMVTFTIFTSIRCLYPCVECKTYECVHINRCSHL